jgi:Tol biopolymer transport system component
MRSAWIFLLVPAAALAQEGDAPTPLVGARSLALSPDGKQLAFTYQGDIWVAPSEGGTAIPVTGSVELDDNPVWSPDGRRIAFSSNRAGNDDIYIVGARGGQPRRLTWHSGADIPSDWSPDGTKILFRASRDAAQGGIYELDIATGRFAAVFLDPVNVSNPKYAPDGNRIAYQRYGFPWVRPRYQGSAAAQLWIYDRANGRRQAVRNNGYQHLWSQWLLDGNLATVTVTQTTPSTTSVGKTVPKVEFTSTRTPNVYGISPAGASSPSRAKAVPGRTNATAKFTW